MMKRGTKRLLVTVMASTLLSTAAFTAMATKSYAEQEKTQTTLKGDTDGIQYQNSCRKSVEWRRQ